VAIRANLGGAVSATIVGMHVQNACSINHVETRENDSPRIDDDPRTETQGNPAGNMALAKRTIEIGLELVARWRSDV
jgi:hypothetical protein